MLDKQQVFDFVADKLATQQAQPEAVEVCLEYNFFTDHLRVALDPHPGAAVWAETSPGYYHLGCLLYDPNAGTLAQQTEAAAERVYNTIVAHDPD
jgi:hypothetical protein